MKIGIVVAMEEEFAKVLSDRNIVKLADAPFRTFSVESGKGEVTAVISGMGKVCAAAGTAYVIEKYGVDEVINFGVCGATKNAFLKGETAVVETAVNSDFDVSILFGEKWKHPSVTFGHGDAGTVLYTADTFATSSDSDGYFDMEGYAVAETARIFGKRCSLLKSVTDILHTDAQNEQFSCNYDRACGLLNEKLKEYI